MMNQGKTGRSELIACSGSEDKEGSYRVVLGDMSLNLQISHLRSRFFANLARIVVAFAALASSRMSLAQMCPACYQNAAAQAPGMLQALKTGVLVMVFPTVVMFGLIAAVVI